MDDQGLALQLREREKELTCLYRLARVLTAFHSEEETAGIVANAVREALSRPDSARVHVRLGTVDAFSPDITQEDTTHRPTPHENNNCFHSAPIVTTVGRIGELTAWYPTAGSTATHASPSVPTIHDREREMMDAVADLLADNAERHRVVEELSATVAAESRKTVALEEVLSRVEELRRRSQAELRAALDADVLPLVSRLEDICHDNPARMLLESLRRALSALGSDQTTHTPAIRARLSPREYEIAQLIASGMPSKQIARMLNLAYGTVERHRHSIRRKLGIRHEAINLATYLRTEADTQ